MERDFKCETILDRAVLKAVKDWYYGETDYYSIHEQLGNILKRYNKQEKENLGQTTISPLPKNNP